MSHAFLFLSTFRIKNEILEFQVITDAGHNAIITGKMMMSTILGIDTLTQFPNKKPRLVAERSSSARKSKLRPGEVALVGAGPVMQSYSL